MKFRGIAFLVPAMLMAILFGCGGGGGGNLTQQTGIVTQPTKAVVKLATSGALPTGKLIGGIEATLTYAAGKGLSIGGSDAVASGVGSGSLLAANTNTAGQVRLGLISTGIQTGEFATATFTIAAGNSPVAGDFAIASGANVIDTDSVAQPGITVGIQSVTFQ